MSSHRLLIFFLLLAVPAFGQTSPSDPLNTVYSPSIDTNCSHSQYASNVWLTNWNAKVRQDTGTNPGSACTLTIYGTQNEFVDFQVHFHDSGSGTSGLNVTVGNFVQTSPNSRMIASSVPGVLIYREAYINVTGYPTNNQLDSAVPGGTNYNTFYNGGPLGYYPDILIPKVDPYWNQTTNAFPFTVAAGKNQSAWVDVLIPPSAPAGYYLGTVTVQTGCPGSCVTVATMPVTIAVWQWPSAGYMPSTTTLKMEASGSGYLALCTNMYNGNGASGNTTLCGNYPGGGGSNDVGNSYVQADLMLLMKDHRYSDGASNTLDIYPQAGSFTGWNALISPIMNGGSLTHNGAATINPILSGAANTTMSLSWLTATSALIWSNWRSNFTTNGWGTAGNPPLYDYLTDEPHTQTDFTNNVYTPGLARHAYLTPAVAELVTTDIYLSQGTSSAANTMSTAICGNIHCVTDQIDWMVTPITTFDNIGSPIQPTSAYTTWLGGSNPHGATRRWWSYGACLSAGTCTNTTPGPAPTGWAYTTYPNYNIDGKPAANRAMEWLTYLHGQTGELYYAVDICDGTGYVASQCGTSATYDPWITPYYAGGWGDGTLVYTGGIVSGKPNYMGGSVTTPLILPSIRLKLARDGVQDYEYLYKLNALGYGTYVNTQLTSWITNSYKFETTGTGLQSARLALGSRIHTLTYANSGNPSPQPPPGLSISVK